MVFAEKRNGANNEQWFSIGGDFPPGVFGCVWIHFGLLQMGVWGVFLGVKA